MKVQRLPVIASRSPLTFSMPGMPPLHIRVLCAGSARLGVLGPLEQSDLVGLDLTKNIHDTLMPDLDVTPRTHPYLEALIDRGDLGMKTGKVFRHWTPDEAEAVRQQLRHALIKSAMQR